MSDWMNFEEQWKTGYPVFEKLFNLKKDELKPLLLEICGENYKELIDNCRVYKSITDDQPNKVEVCFYDKLVITPFGINYWPEHGECSEVVKFNKFFTLNI